MDYEIPLKYECPEIYSNPPTPITWKHGWPPPSTPWLTGWKYRKKHEINGSTAGAVTDYQIRVRVHYGSGTDDGEDVYLGGKCRDDFGDVRFTGDDGKTLLKYWMEEKVDGDYAIFWVKVPSIPADPDKVAIYIYYGNPDATYAGSGDDTFLLFDDFEDGVIDTDKWDYSGAIESGGVVSVDPDEYIWSKQEFGPPFAVRAKWRNAVSNTDGVGLTLDDGSKNWDNTDFAAAAGWNGFTEFAIDLSGKGRKEIGLGLDTEFHIWDIMVKPDGFYTLTDGGYQASYLATPASSYHIWFRAWIWELSGARGEIDWILVRKYVDPEPSHGAWYAEESA